MSNLKVTFTSRESPKKGGRPEPKIAQLLREDASTSRTVLASSFKGPCLTHSAGCEDNRAKPLQYENGMFIVQNASVSDAVRVFSVWHWRKGCFSDNHSDNANGLFHVWQRSTPATWVLDGTFGCASRGPSLFTDMTSGHVHGVRNKPYGNWVRYGQSWWLKEGHKTLFKSSVRNSNRASSRRCQRVKKYASK